MTSHLHRSSSEWQRLIRDERIQPSRSMGQNFLTETDVVRQIAELAEVQPGDLVIEVGPGMGILTRALLERGAQVVGVELDGDIISFLQKDLADQPRFRLYEQDARFISPHELTNGAPYKVIANLPYSVATVILRRFMESNTPPTRMTVMVQKEVAERMTARPGDMSLLGLATDLYTDAAIVMRIPPTVFSPPPKVDSAVVDMHVRTTVRGTPALRRRMFELATMAFQRKRKTIGNGLAMGIGRPKAEIEKTMRDLDIDPGRRPQTLTVDEWIRLSMGLPT